MRVSSSQIHHVAVNAMIDQQSKLSEIQRKVATGEKINSAADDPVAAARMVDLQQSVDTFDQYQSSIESGRANLEIQEGVLESAINVLQRVRELTIQANNAIQTNETRTAIGVEVEQLNNELQALSNSVDSNNDFLFSGSKVKFQPFTDSTDGTFQYNGDDNHKMLQIGPNRQLSIGHSGSEVFRTIRNGNGTFSITQHPDNRGSAVADPGSSHHTYQPGYYILHFSESAETGELQYHVTDIKDQITVLPGAKYIEDAEIEFQGIRTAFKGVPKAGDQYLFAPSKNQDIFTTLKDLESSLKKPVKSPEAKSKFANIINQKIVAIDQAMGNILEIRSNTGSRLKALDNQQEINSSHLLHLKEIQSEIKDLDYHEAVTRLNLRLTGLEASQKAYSKVQNLSMFDYI